MNVTPELVSFVSGVATGLLTNILWEQRRRIRLAIDRRQARQSQVLGFDPAAADLYPVNRWTSHRPLERERLRMHVRDRPEPMLIDPGTWRALADEYGRRHSGTVGYLVDYSIDHREGDRGEVFHYWVAPAGYGEHLATVRFLEEHPESQATARAMFEAGEIGEFARRSPPSLIKINVAILNRANEFMIVQRSGAVTHKKGLWTVGPNETMSLDPHPVPGTPMEDLFGLAERCLREETGLEPADYGQINISWIGYEARTVSVKVFAQVRTRLSAMEVIDRMMAAHSLYESQGVEWLPFGRASLSMVVREWQNGGGPRIWSNSAPLAAQELWRTRHYLDAGPI